ncbi:MAG: hypothetical protein DRQ39_05850 [Gammaproteobacteria bacterium]|nr:MAG: hypothetical protein DRQ39_05850 [Gammaproteobacteria bacterium]
MTTNTWQMCSAYQEGFDHGYAGRHLGNAYSNITELAEAWHIGDVAGSKKRKLECLKYYFISYRVIKQSGGIFYHYAMTDVKPSTWLIHKLTDDAANGDHYHITYSEEVSEHRYTTYKGVFNQYEVILDD